MPCPPKKVAAAERWPLVEVRLYLTMQQKKRLSKLLDLCAGAVLPVSPATENERVACVIN